VTETELETARARTERAAAAARLPPVGVIGAGRAGTVLALALERAGAEVVAVASRRRADASRLAGRLRPGALALAAEAVVDRVEVVVVAVPDDRLAALALRLAGLGRAWPDRVVVHCAGRFDRHVLGPLRASGVAVAALHPLAAMARPDPAQLDGVAAALDADPRADARVRRLARRMGLRPVALAPEQRAAYHAAAALAGSLPLILLAAAERVGRETGLPPALVAGLRPLLSGAVRNAERLGTAAALTGPAARGDAGTVAAHAAVLGRLDPALERLYRAATALTAARVAGAA